MNYRVMREAQQWAIDAARAVPGVRWTILLPTARMTYWTDVGDGWVQHVSNTTASQHRERETKRRKRAPREAA